MTFEEDLRLFREMEPSLSAQHKGKFVLIKDGQNHGIFSNYEDAHKEALKKFGAVEVVIAQIGVNQPLNYLATAAG